MRHAWLHRILKSSFCVAGWNSEQRFVVKGGGATFTVCYWYFFIHFKTCKHKLVTCQTLAAPSNNEHFQAARGLISRVLVCPQVLCCPVQTASRMSLSCCSYRCGKTISLNCGLQRVYCSSLRWYRYMENNGGMILVGGNRRNRRKSCPSATLSITNPT
jgi:hypothetical protein